MYNRASADPEGKPWSEKKKWVWWDAEQKKWAGYDVPDYIATKPPTTKRSRARRAWMRSPAPLLSSCGRTAWVGCSCRRAWSTARCRRTTSRSSRRSQSALQTAEQPGVQILEGYRQPLAKLGDPKFPYVITTYRLTEHYLAGAMSRWLPWLTSCSPNFSSRSVPSWPGERHQESRLVQISSPRTQVRAKALVTRRMRPFTIDGKVVHQVGMPWHWGYEGLSTGDVVNELTSLVADPNVSMHEGKAFVCNVEKA
jgi:formate dehydrogenase major subunit